MGPVKRQSQKMRLRRKKIALWWADGTAGNLYICQLHFNELKPV